MRTRQKLTAVGALALASSAIGGGAVATSHAMAADSPTPDKGTMTVISMTADSDGAIKCVYDDIDLPTVGVGTGIPGDGPTTISGQSTNVVTGSGPVDANGKPIAGAVMVSTGSAGLPDGAPPAGAPTLVVTGSADGTATEAGTSAGGADETTQARQVPPGLPPLDSINSVDARPGTAEECAAMKPTTALAPPALTP